ncbi:MAG: hypothetical protein L3K10_06295, partial [Thermoplasmata archaeon]|nr:hypothetical protein [Thermoplasmata archaeon]
STVRYAEIQVGVASGFNWTGGFPSPPLAWSSLTNQNNLLAFQFNTTANPIVLNITILYSVPGGSAYYVGVFAFYVGIPGGSSVPSLMAVTTTSGTSLGSGVNVESLSSLPATILLANHGGTP